MNIAEQLQTEAKNRGYTDKQVVIRNLTGGRTLDGQPHNHTDTRIALGDFDDFVYDQDDNVLYYNTKERAHVIYMRGVWASIVKN